MFSMNPTELVMSVEQSKRIQRIIEEEVQDNNKS